MLFKVHRDGTDFLGALRARGVLMIEYPHNQIRAVTHYGITPADVDSAVAATRRALEDTASRAPAMSRVAAG